MKKVTDVPTTIGELVELLSKYPRDAELNVSIECAVTIEEAEQAALAAGMTYPSQSQILVPGQAIPSGGFRNSGSAPSDSENGSEPSETPGEGDSEAEPDAAG